jgi:hypothetical protein
MICDRQAGVKIYMEFACYVFESKTQSRPKQNKYMEFVWDKNADKARLLIP